MNDSGITRGQARFMIFLIILCVCIVVACFWLRDLVHERANANPPMEVAVQAAPAPEVADQPKKPVITKNPPRVYADGAAIKNQLKLPPEVIRDPVQEVVTSTRVEPDDHAQTLTTTLNTETGEFDTYIKREPLPWIGAKQRGEASLAIIAKNGEPTARLQLRHEFAQIKALHVGAIVGADQPLNSALSSGEVYGGLQVWINW
jgi:hypothetical protein